MKGTEGTWALTTNLVGKICYERKKKNRKVAVGDMICLAIWNNGSWWGGSGISKKETLSEITEMAYLKDPENDTLDWVAPEGMYWICGKYAYGYLPKGWYGSCILGIIKPSFFLLPIERKQLLGLTVYDDLSDKVRAKRAIQPNNVEIGTWKDDDWTPEKIIKYYGPATWAEDGTLGAREPIYILNRVIRLQAVLEIITNDTISTLTHLAKESVKSRTYIMQNRLALDYLLAQEGGVCGKFNLSNCCIEVDESGKVVKEITDKMIKLAHVPVQTWRGLTLDGVNNWLGGWFTDWKELAKFAILGFLAIMFFPCLIPLIQTLIKRTMKSMTLITTSIESGKKETMLVMRIGRQGLKEVDSECKNLLPQEPKENIGSYELLKV
ncbi:endogenous retrovirus group 3 member 1 Env polyprotein-like isoform X2 [Crotalus tigris]|uniref:endogenous retrovirus group 3 member 1 Env polyprotein-like isoform X2 n=1 Tax=Crotalus tigris TaxID=88082 RepID=UPI00192F5978|nr:endogenous retrovirus group 3 member 1 Env polyprotein-like isoform X2 [Crotalus tigris]